MGTLHMGQIGWDSFEDVSALGTAHLLSVASPIILVWVSQSRFRLLFKRMNVAAVFTLVKVGVARIWRTNGGFPFECAATKRATTRIHVRASHALLHHLTWKTRRPSGWFQ
jgi:hypothetical protein